MDIQERIENRIQERIERRIHKKGFSIATTLLTMILSALVMLAAVLTVYSISSMRSGMEEQVLDGLRDLNIAVGAAYNGVSDEEYALNENGDLVKGNVNITQDTDLIDSFSQGSDVKVTIFWGDTRVATSLKDPATGERMVGTKASDEVIDTVLNKGKDFYSKNLTLIGEKYYVYYIPLKNANNEIVGMVFAGKPAAALNELINRKIMGTVGMSVLMLIIIAVIGVLMVFKISKGIKVAEAELTKLAEGDLNISLPEKFLKSGDEIGAMAVAIENLGAILRNIIGKIKDAAGQVQDAGDEMDTATSQTSANADDIGRAVEDISRGAISQAEEIENATGQVASMGDMIEQIARNMDDMSSSSNEMKRQGEESVQIIERLSEANDKTVEAIKRIGEQIRTTDESVNKIRESITLISSIADETSLLSLNASIEAARAGESGRGFAVVASEIQKLAEESNESAIQIEEIITKLSEESETSIKLMEGVQQIISEQQHKLKETRSKFEQVNSGISHAKSQTENVTEMTKTCDESRVKVVDVISNLSAISEENAASSEETNASMEELNATINILAAQAKSLKELSNSLINEVDFFKL